MGRRGCTEHLSSLQGAKQGHPSELPWRYRSQMLGQAELGASEKPDTLPGGHFKLIYQGNFPALHPVPADACPGSGELYSEEEDEGGDVRPDVKHGRAGI